MVKPSGKLGNFRIGRLDTCDNGLFAGTSNSEQLVELCERFGSGFGAEIEVNCAGARVSAFFSSACPSIPIRDQPKSQLYLGAMYHIDRNFGYTAGHIRYQCGAFPQPKACLNCCQ